MRHRWYAIKFTNFKCMEQGIFTNVWFSQWSVWMWELEYKESWAQKNSCFWAVLLEKAFESPLDFKEIQPVHPTLRRSVLSVHWKDWCWSWNSNTLATWCEELAHLKRPWCWEILKAGGEADDRGWDGWMTSPTQQTGISVNSGSWRWTQRPGVLQSMGSQRVGNDWATELNWKLFLCRGIPNLCIWCLSIWGGTDVIMMDIKCTISDLITPKPSSTHDQ